MIDAINPSHYKDGKIEVIDFIEDKNFNYNRGNVIKYVSRAGKKDPNKELEDLKKAQWYLNREVDILEGGTQQLVVAYDDPIISSSHWYDYKTSQWVPKQVKPEKG